MYANYICIYLFFNYKGLQNAYLENSSWCYPSEYIFPIAFFLVLKVWKEFPLKINIALKFRHKKPPEHQTDLTILELLKCILSLKQQAQRIEKE
jgi:hypothetical protein